MFQDSAGTIPVTAVGQPVGKILDKSGRGNHATQATAAARPILQQDGNGKYYLSFDGVDDFLSTGNINFTVTDKITAILGIKHSDATGFDGVFSIGAGAPGTIWTYSNAANLEFKIQGASAVAGGVFPAQTGTTSVLVYNADLSAASAALALRMRRNGAALMANSYPNNNAPGAGNFSNNSLAIGSAAGVWLNGFLYGLIVRGAATADPSAAEAWMNDKTGAY